MENKYWHHLPNIQKKLKKKLADDNWRLNWHLLPETGWLNDPNGVIQFQNQYHVFHQYTPESAAGAGKRHWGHKVSDDLVNFTEEEIFLSPENPFDKDGVFSGSAFEKDNKLHFFYTGNVEQEGDHDYNFSGREQNTIHVTSSDGYTVDYQNVIIPYSDYPAGYSDHIRDPKVFEKNGKFYLILGARTQSNKGAILLYHSEDLYDWEYSGVLAKGDINEGFMWECPDLFELNKVDLLMFSPQGLLPTKYHYHNPYSTVYQLGKMNWLTGKFEQKSDFHQLDHGFDFYAPQTFLDDKNRRIMWGWMGIGDTEPEYSNPTISRGWQHALTMPRELQLINKKLVQIPLEEYRILRGKKKKITLAAMYKDKLAGESYEMYLAFDEKPTNLELTLREDTKLMYQNEEFILKHGRSGYGRRIRKIKLETLRNLRIFSDTSSMEIFINDGEEVFTTRLYPKLGADLIKINKEHTGTVLFWELSKNNS